MTREHSTKTPFTVVSVVGARPQFVKAAMVSRALHTQGITEILVHTGQHYDSNLSDSFFTELRIPDPKYNLGVGSQSQTQQLAAMLERLDTILVQEKPHAVIVYGDTNSTLAGALAAAKRSIPVVHVEAGMRSFDKNQPEEINRVVTDHLSELLLCVTPAAQAHLAREGITKGVVHIGDVMYDALLAMRNQTDDATVLSELALESGKYILTTIHRPESTDNPNSLKAVVTAIRDRKHRNEKVVFPLHPRTRAALQARDFLKELESEDHVTILDPQPYAKTLVLAANARVIFTESGGLQKEAYFLGIPTVNPRDRTEWNELVAAGWQAIANYDAELIGSLLDTAKPGHTTVDGFGDGHAAERAAHVIRDFLQSRAE